MTLPKVRTLVLADDQIAVRELLKEYLEFKMPDCRVVGEASAGREALELMARTQPSAIVADVFFQDLAPLDFLDNCRASFSGIRIIAFCRWGQITMARKLIAAGAHGIVAKGDSIEVLQSAILAVLQGGYYLAPAIEEALYQEKREGAGLTDRELSVLKLIAEGCPTKEVGTKLEISTKTAEKYRERIMQKLHLHDVVSLTRYAIRNGLAAL